MQLFEAEDGSKEALPEIQKSTGSRWKTSMGNGANKNVKDGCERLTLNAIDVQLFYDQRPKIPLVENTKVRNQSVNCEETNVDRATDKDVENLVCSSVTTYDNAAFKNEKDENKTGKEGTVLSDHDQPIGQSRVDPKSNCHDEEFSAKYLLCFAWQIARGMVSSHLLDIKRHVIHTFSDVLHQQIRLLLLYTVYEFLKRDNHRSFR